MATASLYLMKKRDEVGTYLPSGSASGQIYVWLAFPSRFMQILNRRGESIEHSGIPNGLCQSYAVVTSTTVWKNAPKKLKYGPSYHKAKPI